MLNNRGSSLIFVVSLAVLLNIVFASIYFTVNRTQKSTSEKKNHTSTLTLAEAGKEKLYGEISQKTFIPTPDTRIDAYSNFTFGKGSFSVNCLGNTALDTVWIESTGKENTSISTINVIAAIQPDVNIAAPPVRGAVMARSNIIVKGNINIDGRDHDTNGVVINTGVYGVSTCQTLSVQGSSTIGGNGLAPVDKNTIDPVRSTVAEENAPVSGLFQSPEAFLGLPPGALDNYKVSSLTTPIHGIVYLTNDNVGPVHFGDSYGILIVHNSSKSAELHITDGNFKGLIITDLMAAINGNTLVIGAVTTLNDGEVSTFGTGTADILYSSYVLNNLNKYCPNIKKKITELSWKEVKK